MPLSAPSGRPNGKQYLDVDELVDDQAHRPEVGDLLLDEHAQALLDVIERRLLRLRDGADAVGPASMCGVLYTPDRLPCTCDAQNANE